MRERKTLADLYVVGAEFKVTDDKGNEVEVWVQKPNPVDQDVLIKKANAARSKILLQLRDQESEEWLSAYSDVNDIIGRDGLVEIILGDELNEVRLSAEAEESHEDRWRKDGYLDGLLEAWQHGGMKEMFARDPEDEEAKAVFEALSEFEAEVQKRVDGERTRLVRDYGDKTDEELYREAADRLLRQRALAAFIEEYDHWLVFLCTFDLERDEFGQRTKHFANVVQVKGLDPRTRKPLLEKIREMQVDEIEGKDWRATGTSLPSPEPAPEAGTSLPSGPPESSP